MPHGFFTVERWKPQRDGAMSRWFPILHLDSYQSLTKAIGALKQRGHPGLYRVVQTQRCIWAEIEGGQLRLHGSHVSSRENLARFAKIYEGEGGRRPVEKAQRARAQTKANRAGK